MNGRRGRIGLPRARLRRRDGELRFRLGLREWPLDDIVLDHRDEDGRITFRVVELGGRELARVRYRRRGPRARDLWWDAIDFTADEPWSWEDSDFGLFCFHVATNTGPMKFRHRLGLPEPFPQLAEPAVRFDDRIVRHHLAGARAGFVEEVAWDALTDITVKFEISGIWSDKSVLVLREPSRLAVVPISSVDGLPEGFEEQLAALPGFDAAARAVVAEAVAYALDREWPHPDDNHRWAERPVWRLR